MKPLTASLLALTLLAAPTLAHADTVYNIQADIPGDAPTNTPATTLAGTITFGALLSGGYGITGDNFTIQSADHTTSYSFLNSYLNNDPSETYLDGMEFEATLYGTSGSVLLLYFNGQYPLSSLPGGTTTICSQNASCLFSLAPGLTFPGKVASSIRIRLG